MMSSVCSPCAVGRKRNAWHSSASPASARPRCSATPPRARAGCRYYGPAESSQRRRFLSRRYSSCARRDPLPLHRARKRQPRLDGPPALVAVSRRQGLLLPRHRARALTASLLADTRATLARAANWQKHQSIPVAWKREGAAVPSRRPGFAGAYLGDLGGLARVRTLVIPDPRCHWPLRSARLHCFSRARRIRRRSCRPSRPPRARPFRFARPLPWELCRIALCRLIPRPGNDWRACLPSRMAENAASSPQPPDLPADLERGELIALAHDASYTNVELTDVELASQQANGVTFDTTRLVKRRVLRLAAQRPAAR